MDLHYVNKKNSHAFKEPQLSLFIEHIPSKHHVSFSNTLSLHSGYKENFTQKRPKEKKSNRKDRQS